LTVSSQIPYEIKREVFALIIDQLDWLKDREKRQFVEQQGLLAVISSIIAAYDHSVGKQEFLNAFCILEMILVSDYQEFLEARNGSIIPISESEITSVSIC